MGEIATWSAVKTKVGLGKDSNECPTKAELLALSPTGTGENYVGLEISNASSYGNNETVKLEDIHKVTYKYSFSIGNPIISFPATGGSGTPSYFSIPSTKTKYLDGVAVEGSTINVGYNNSGYPSWITPNNIEEGIPHQAAENTSLEARSATITYTQYESGKQVVGTFSQEAASQTFEYTFNTRYPSIDFNALGKVSSTNTELGFISTRQEYRNGKAYGNAINVEYNGSEKPDWLSFGSGGWSAQENKSTNSRSVTITYIQNESNKKITATFTQAAGVKTYDTPTVYLGTIADIPASGGTAATPTYTYTQLWGWNGKTNDGGTINSGASVVWSENVSGSNLGTTAKARTKLGSRTLTVTLNGKSGNASIDIYQAQNRIENTTQGAWVVSISANPSTFTEKGGTSQITASASASRTNHWSSGATSAAADAIGTPTLSLLYPVTGFSLSGNILTVAENTTANERSVIVRATMDTVGQGVTVNQSAYLVEWEYTFTATPTTLNFDALGTAKSITITSYREKYINGSLVDGSRENVTYIHATSTEHIGNVLGTSIGMQENETTSSRTGQVSYEQNGSGKVIRITCNQAAGTISESWVLREISGFGTIPAVGGQVSAVVESGYYDVINGSQRTWHNVAPEVDNNPGWISLTSIQYNNNDTYTVKATGISNSSESGRSSVIAISNSSKNINLSIVQSGASVSYNYYFEISPKVLNVPAKPIDPEPFSVSSYKKKVVNGSETSETIRVGVTIDTIDENWIEATIGSMGEGEVMCLENTVSSIRSVTLTIRQEESGNLDQIDINQAAATIDYRYEFKVDGKTGDFDYPNTIASTGGSARLTVWDKALHIVNGVETGDYDNMVWSYKPDGFGGSVVPDWVHIGQGVDFSTITFDANKTDTDRLFTITYISGGEGNPDILVTFTQKAADVQVTYDLRWALSDRGNTFEDRVSEYSLDTGGEADRLHLFLLCDKITRIGTEEISRTPVQTGLSNLTTAGPVYTDIGGEPSAIIQDDGGHNTVPTGLFPEIKDYENCYNIVIGSIQNLGLVQEEISMTFNKPVMDGTTQIGKVPTFLFYVDAVPYSQVMEYQFRGAGDAGAGSTYDVIVPASDGTGYFSIISFRAYLRNGVEFKREYLEPTFTAPTDVTIIKNGQNSDNSYDYALKVTDNPGEIERQWDIPFINPVTGSQIHLYLTQEAPAVEQLTCELGNYYGYQASDFVNMGFGWSSKDGGDSTGSGGMTTPGGYLGARIYLPAGNDSIDMSAVGTPTYAKPLKIRLANIRKEKEEGYGNVTFTGLSVGYSQQDYRLGIVMGVGMESYFQLTPSILSESGDQGGGLQIQVTLKQTYNGYQGDSIADITLTPKDSNLPTLYLNIAWGNP